MGGGVTARRAVHVVLVAHPVDEQRPLLGKRWVSIDQPHEQVAVVVVDAQEWGKTLRGYVGFGAGSIVAPARAILEGSIVGAVVGPARTILMGCVVGTRRMVVAGCVLSGARRIGRISGRRCACRCALACEAGLPRHNPGIQPRKEPTAGVGGRTD